MARTRTSPPLGALPSLPALPNSAGPPEPPLGAQSSRTPPPGDVRLVEQLSLFCQRWSGGRASYRPAGEPFDPRFVSVEPIDEREAKAYVLRAHYAGSYPSARFRAGVRIKEPFRPERLGGVGVFSVPMNQRVIPSYFDGFDPNHGVELGRFVLDEDLAANAESYCLARMFRLLRTALPEVRGLLAYSDPLERRNEQGELVKRGHVGTIYKATNAAFRGRSSPRTLWLSPSGACFSDRLLSKVRLGETGERYALERLSAGGAPRRELHESGSSYIERLKSAEWLRPSRHPGNLAFTWDLR
jgi:hypothetical protein